jgi:DNA-binding MarR family transcriptional regulator
MISEVVMNELFNQHILSRLLGIQEKLKALHKAVETASSATKGDDRELFINEFLSEVLPPQFRFGHGDITDLSGKRSGQVDIVVEYPFFPSLPLGKGSSRLYLAEGVAAVIEVKSNLNSNQWSKVKKTSQRLQQLKRGYGSNDVSTPRYIPLFAVGYKGWSKAETLNQKLAEGVVNGILVIDEPGLFVWNPPLYVGRNSLIKSASGPWSLWGFIVCLHHLAISLQQTNFAPALYAMPSELLLYKIYHASYLYTNGEVVVFNITDNEGISRTDAKQIINYLEESKLLIKKYEIDDLIIVSVTEEGKRLGARLREILH